MTNKATPCQLLILSYLYFYNWCMALYSALVMFGFGEWEIFHWCQIVIHLHLGAWVYDTLAQWLWCIPGEVETLVSLWSFAHGPIGSLGSQFGECLKRCIILCFAGSDWFRLSSYLCLIGHFSYPFPFAFLYHTTFQIWFSAVLKLCVVFLF